MTSAIQSKINEVRKLCATHHARKLHLFGSAATDKFDGLRSDVDLVVEFAPLSPTEHAESYLGLLADLEDLLGSPVDMLEAKAVRNPYLLAEIERTRVILYDAA